MRSYADMLTHPEVGKLRYALNDLRGLEDLNIFHEGMMHMAQTISTDAAERPAPWEIAIVASRRDMMPLLTDYCAQVSRAGTTRCQVFADIHVAVDWLGLPSTVMDLPLSCGRRIADPRPLDPGVTASPEQPDPADGGHRQKS